MKFLQISCLAASLISIAYGAAVNQAAVNGAGGAPQAQPAVAAAVNPQVAAVTPQSTPVAAVNPQVAAVTPQNTPVAAVTPQAAGVTPQNTPVAAITPQNAPVAAATPQTVPVAVATPQAVPVAPEVVAVNNASVMAQPVAGATLAVPQTPQNLQALQASQVPQAPQAPQVAAPATVTPNPAVAIQASAAQPIAASSTPNPAAAATQASAAQPVAASSTLNPAAAATQASAARPAAAANAGAKKEEEEQSVIDDAKQLLDQAAAFYARNVAPDGTSSNPEASIPNQIKSTRRLIAKLKGLLIELRLQKLEAEVFQKNAATVASIDKKITEVRTFWAAHAILLGRLLNGEKVGPVTVDDFNRAVAGLDRGSLGVPLTDLMTKPSGPSSGSASGSPFGSSLASKLGSSLASILGSSVRPTTSAASSQPMSSDAVLMAARALLERARQKVNNCHQNNPATITTTTSPCPGSNNQNQQPQNQTQTWQQQGGQPQPPQNQVNRLRAKTC